MIAQIGAFVAIILLLVIVYLYWNRIEGKVWIVPRSFLESANIPTAKIGATFDADSLILLIEYGGVSFVQTYRYDLNGRYNPAVESSIELVHESTVSANGSTIGQIIPDGTYQIKIASESLLIYDNDRTLLSLWTTS